jgi:arginyl-tRNA synthetase
METLLENKTADINAFKVIPEHLGMGFGFCVYGDINESILELAYKCSFKIVKADKYTNFFPTENTDFLKMFPVQKKFKYMDGFSPNLNKHLHIGHFSNLVLAKAFQGMDTAEQYISILGDTLTGDVTKEEAFEKFIEYCKAFNYKVDKIFYASEMKCDESKLVNGTEKYEGTKIIEAGENKVVAIKKDGSTSYFYQDIALASLLNESTLYLTGYEQENHFNILKTIFPHTNHIGLGLVKFMKFDKLEVNEKPKMSTRLGNVIFLSDLMSDLMKEFDGNQELSYNIFAGYILKNNPQSDKVFNAETIKNPKNSPGLYLSYTMARMKSAGVEVKYNESFIKQSMQFYLLKSQQSLNPSILFNALVDLCKEINTLYIDHQISGNEENKKMFGLLLSDLALGMKKLGMFEVDKV